MNIEGQIKVMTRITPDPSSEPESLAWLRVRSYLEEMFSAEEQLARVTRRYGIRAKRPNLSWMLNI